MRSEELLLLSSVLLSACQPADDRGERHHLGIINSQGEFIPAHLLKWFEDAGWTGAINEDVDATVGVACRLHQGFYLLRVPDIRLNGERLSTVGVILRHNLRGGGRVLQVIDNDIGSTCS